MPVPAMTSRPYVVDRRHVLSSLDRHPAASGARGWWCEMILSQPPASHRHIVSLGEGRMSCRKDSLRRDDAAPGAINGMLNYQFSMFNGACIRGMVLLRDFSNYCFCFQCHHHAVRRYHVALLRGWWMVVFVARGRTTEKW